MSRVLTEAIEAAEAATELPPERREAVLPALLGQVPELGEAEPSGDDVTDACYLAGLLSHLGLPGTANTLLNWARRGARVGSPRALRVENLRGVYAAARGDAQLATKILEDALASAPPDERVLRTQLRANLAAAYLRTGDQDYARERATAVLAGDPTTDPRARLLAASVYLATDTPHPMWEPAFSILDDATTRLAAMAPEQGLEALAGLASSRFELAAADGRWADAEVAADVLAVAAQRLSAMLGADHPRAVAVQALVAIVDARQAEWDGSVLRLQQGVEALARMSERVDLVLGPQHPRSVSVGRARDAVQLARARVVAVTELTPRTAAWLPSASPAVTEEQRQRTRQLRSRWEEFGRVEEDGTVRVKTADGERVVGAWHAGPPDEGLAHFARRYEDLLTEVELLEIRLRNGAANPAGVLANARRLRASLADAAVVGDLDTLADRLDQLAGVAQQMAGVARAARDTMRAEVYAQKVAIVDEAEKLDGDATGWKAAGDRFRELHDEWKAAPRLDDRRTETALWKRFTAARDRFVRERGAHFATLDAQRKLAAATKEKLVAEAESLATSTDWADTARRLRDLMAEWKAAPRASREVEQRLWERFRAAQDTFFGRRAEMQRGREAASGAEYDQRLALLREAEALDVEADPRAAQARLREISRHLERGGSLGHREQVLLDRRLRAAKQRVQEAMDALWRTRYPEENPLLAQMRAQVAEAEQRLARAVAAGDQKRMRDAAEALHTKQMFLNLAEAGD